MHWHEHPASRHMATARIQANLHAVLRFTENRPFKKGDIADFATAAVAIPVCDALFTDKRLVQILQDPRAKIQEYCDCRLVHGFDRFTAYLRELA